MELRDHLAPSDKSYDLVLKWLKSQGLTELSTVEDDWIIVDGTIGDAEKLLETEYSSFQNSETGKVTVRTLEYSLRKHLSVVYPSSVLFSLSGLLDFPRISTAPTYTLNQSSGNMAILIIQPRSQGVARSC